MTARAHGCLAVLLLMLKAAEGALPSLSERDFKGSGICQLALHGFAMPAQSEKAINDSVQQLLERHRTTLGFKTRPDFRLRMRFFGAYADYTNAIDRRALQGRPFTVAGFYTSATKEIVTWRQQMPGFLGTTLLHEASHAIMDAHYENVPAWLMEGSADYFAFALHPPGELQQRMLRQRWTRLNQWLRERSLLPLESLVNADGSAFKQLDPEMAYTMSWSLFQLLMSSGASRQMMLTMLGERQSLTGEPMPCAKQIDRLHPGGLQRLEVAWHAWIVAGSSATNAPASRSGGVGIR